MRIKVGTLVPKQTEIFCYGKTRFSFKEITNKHGMSFEKLYLPSEMIESSSMLNVVLFCCSSGMEADEEEAPVVVAAHSAPL